MNQRELIDGLRRQRQATLHSQPLRQRRKNKRFEGHNLISVLFSLSQGWYKIRFLCESCSSMRFLQPERKNKLSTGCRNQRIEELINPSWGINSLTQRRLTDGFLFSAVSLCEENLLCPSYQHFSLFSSLFRCLFYNERKRREKTRADKSGLKVSPRCLVWSWESGKGLLVCDSKAKDQRELNLRQLANS